MRKECGILFYNELNFQEQNFLTEFLKTQYGCFISKKYSQNELMLVVLWYNN